MEMEAYANGNQFPAGLRILAVDEDINVLNLIQEMCTRCHYHVTPCSEARVALNLLRERNVPFDLILSGVRMPDMDGFEFLQQVTNEINVPVIMMSMPEESTTSAVMRAITNGASEFFIKPLREEQFRTIWQHVMRKAFKEENITSLEEYDRKRRGSDSSVTDDEGVAADAATKENASTKEAVVDESEINGYTPAQKKRRIVWTTELHENFMRAVTQIGLHKAVPKRILEVMNVPDLTRENVASHLQKFRNFVKRSNAEAQQQNGMSNRSKLGGYKGFEALVACSYIPPEMLSNYQSVVGFPNNDNVQMNSTLQHQQIQQQALMQIHSNNNGFQSSQTPTIGYNNNVMLPRSSNFSGIAQFPVDNNRGRSMYLPTQHLQNTSLKRSSSVPIITQGVPYGSSTSGHDSQVVPYVAPVENSCTDMIECNTLNQDPSYSMPLGDLPPSSGYP